MIWYNQYILNVTELLSYLKLMLLASFSFHQLQSVFLRRQKYLTTVWFWILSATFQIIFFWNDRFTHTSWNLANCMKNVEKWWTSKQNTTSFFLTHHAHIAPPSGSETLADALTRDAVTRVGARERSERVTVTSWEKKWLDSVEWISVKINESCKSSCLGHM